MKKGRETAERLLKFLDQSPSSFHAVWNMKERLLDEGFEKLREDERWSLQPGGRYVVTRNGSALIAFTIPSLIHVLPDFRIIASHSDSPCFKIKENPEMIVEENYVKLNVEGYGGMILSSWLDRPLSIAGRVIVKEEGAYVSKLVNVDRDLLVIPNLAIHMNREINKGYAYNKQKDMLPFFGGIESKGQFMQLIQEAAEVDGDILGHDLFLYNRQRGTIFGADDEFIASGRLDDLQCAFASMEGFLSAEKKEHISVCCILDNEEVGSGTKQGAASTFLKDVLQRICFALGYDEEDYRVAIAKSFMLSADNAHAVHPNHPEKTDPNHKLYLNCGIVLKMNADQKYCTDGVSAAMFKDLCNEIQIPVQFFVNRSDMAGGSTLGNISSTQVPVMAVDIGLPQLSMHSAYETAGVDDTWYLIQAAKAFYA